MIQMKFGYGISGALKRNTEKELIVLLQLELCYYNLNIMCKFNTIYVILTQKLGVILAQFVDVLV